MATIESWANVAKRIHVHEETYDLDRLCAETGFKSYRYMESVEECRRLYDKAMLHNWDHKFDGTVSELNTTAKGDAQPAIPITVFSPNNKDKVDPKIMIHIHGGGFIMGSVKGYSRMLQRMASAARVIMVGVEYRLIPEVGDRYAPMNDCYHAVRWIAANKEAVGGTEKSKLGISGDSAGGNAALLLGLDFPEIEFEVTIYPVPDLSLELQSMKEFQIIPICAAIDSEWLGRMASSLPPAKPNDPALRACFRKDLRTSPPALMIVPDLDPWRSGMLEYADRVRKAGRFLKVSHYSGVPHSFTAFLDVFKKTADLAFADIAAFIKSLD